MEQIHVACFSHEEMLQIQSMLEPEELEQIVFNWLIPNHD